ncbi:class I SAM-dependent methyltransferase [Dyella solisilvae]|uniref:Class I SAM-dependent methyltransferase n=1 Tax=Dyella solisilvae TaxID=1920168 RepID=A0A370KDC6_9GAMM|nr:class I SAM-dependent methyltransferase [Dyella solisilvae]RDJ00655.1 class I SAM-dependent methyltransferase [Dyella solisilvae]
MDATVRYHIADSYEHWFQRRYVNGKLATDPAYAAVAALVADRPLPLLDIGCGIGLLGQYLYAQGAVSGYLGLDHDLRKIEAGRRALRLAGLERQLQLRHADGANTQPMRGHVALLDVLHYLPAEGQRALLANAVAHLAPGGLLIIRNVLRERSWRYLFTRLSESILSASGWMGVGAQHYPSADELRAPLEAAGLVVTLRPLHGRTPFDSYLIVAERQD